MIILWEADSPIVKPRPTARRGFWSGKRSHCQATRQEVEPWLRGTRFLR